MTRIRRSATECLASSLLHFSRYGMRGSGCDTGPATQGDGGLSPADAHNTPRSAGCVSKVRSPAGSLIQRCLLQVHKCTVGRNHKVSSSLPARTVRTGVPGLEVPLIHEPPGRRYLHR